MSTTNVPLVVRLRDLGPALSHQARARLAVARIRRAAEDQAADEDRQQATDELYRLAAHGPAVADFTATVITTRETLGHALIAYRPPTTYARARGLRRLVGQRTVRIG